MNKKILILSRRDDRPEYDTAKTMISGLSKYNNRSDIEFYASFLEDMRFYFDGTELTITDTINNCDIRDYDGTFIIGWFKTKKTEDLALSVATYLQFYEKKVLNTEVFNNRSRSKLSQLVYASLNGVKTTKFLAINDFSQINDFFHGTNLNFPLIVKSASASRGNDNHLVNDLTELKGAIKNQSNKIMLIQDFVPNDGDYRVIVMGGKVKLVIHRKSNNDSHLNNTSKGGSASLVTISDLPKEVIDQSITISKLLKREITGVDMIQHNETGEFYMLEVNNMPQLSTGSFVEEKAQVLSDFLTRWV